MGRVSGTVRVISPPFPGFRKALQVDQTLETLERLPCIGAPEGTRRPALNYLDGIAVRFCKEQALTNIHPTKRLGSFQMALWPTCNNTCARLTSGSVRTGKDLDLAALRGHCERQSLPSGHKRRSRPTAFWLRPTWRPICRCQAAAPTPSSRLRPPPAVRRFADSPATWHDTGGGGE